ncbi:hypothetical protein EHQ59_01580 [Leptospira kemamanensis]|uniref:Uncharacterized protein n=1 Tax=Leptospira kemamanensis TaxID=2484942 RepID=A0A4R9JTA5_9LEPT|nr:hypothetical protein [Leptospira kemamanensis]TGL55968.1 hypothetical protein EHQ59_01580 [Leptospira kemamanensis]
MSLRTQEYTRFHWLLWFLIFFSGWSCQNLNSLLFREAKSEIPASVLFLKSPRKMNPSVFKDGSSHYRCIQWEPGKLSGYVEKIEFSFIAYDPNFVSKINFEFGNETIELYKIIWTRKVGKFQKDKLEKKYLFQYKESFFKEVKGNNIQSLLENQIAYKENKTSIDEIEVFEIVGDTGNLIEEGNRSEIGGENRWSHSIGSNQFFTSSSLFTKINNQTISTEHASTHYDYLQLSYEWNESEPDKLFFKPIFKENDLQLYFVPPYTNGLTTKTKEPFGYKRMGDFLLKEEMK